MSLANRNIEKSEEAKLRQKFPNLNPKGIGNSVLQKRLHKNQKYFDSGDYNMAKAKVLQKNPLPPTQEKVLLQESTGDTIPTPENVPAVRKKSLHPTEQQHQYTHPEESTRPMSYPTGQ